MNNYKRQSLRNPFPGQNISSQDKKTEIDIECLADYFCNAVKRRNRKGICKPLVESSKQFKMLEESA